MSSLINKYIRVGDWGLAALFTLGTALRFLNLGRQSVWIDEGHSWLISRLSFVDLFLYSWQDVHPPLYFYLLKALLHFVPSTEYGLRLLSVLCSVATLATVILFARQQWGHRAAWYAGLLVAISPLDIYYAQEARMYSLLALLFALSFVFLMKSLQSGKRSHLAGWAAAVVGLAWTHAYGLMAVFLQVGFVMVYWGWQRLRGRMLPLNGRRLSATLAGIAVFIFPMLILFWGIKGTSAGAGASKIPDLHNVRYLLTFWSTGPMDAFPTFNIPWRMRDVAIVGTVGCFVAGAMHCWRRGAAQRLTVYLAGTLVILPPAIMYGYTKLTQHALWIERGFIGNAQIFLILAGIGLAAMRPRLMRGLVIVAIAVPLISGEMFYFTKWEKSRAAKAFRSLPATDAHKILLASPNWLNCEAYFYLGDRMQLWGIRPSSPGQLIRIVCSQRQMPKEMASPEDDLALRAASDVYAYGDPEKLRAERSLWPRTFASKRIWVFEELRWRLIDEQAEGVRADPVSKKIP